MEKIRYDGQALSFDQLEQLLHQPFAHLPGDCSASVELVRETRICIEVLRHKALADGKTMAANVASKEHAVRAYNALLAALGTSSQELRLLRGAALKDRERKAQSLGISVNRLNGLLLHGRDLSELSLEAIFGLQDSRRDPLSFGAVLGNGNNDILRLQLKGITWRKNTDASGWIYGLITSGSTGGTTIQVTLFKDRAHKQPIAIGEGNTGDMGLPSVTSSHNW